MLSTSLAFILLPLLVVITVAANPVERVPLRPRSTDTPHEDHEDGVHPNVIGYRECISSFVRGLSGGIRPAEADVPVLAGCTR